MLLNGAILAGITTLCYGLIYNKLPRKIKRWIIERSLFTEISATALTYFIHISFGTGVTVLISAIFTGLMTSICLAVARDAELSAAFQQLLKKLGGMKDGLIKILKDVMVEQPKMIEA